MYANTGVRAILGPPKMATPDPHITRDMGTGVLKCLAIWRPRGRETLAIWGSFSDLGTLILSALIQLTALILLLQLQAGVSARYMYCSDEFMYVQHVLIT